MAISDAPILAGQVPQELVQYWGWILAFGIGLVVLGIIAIVRAVTATVASMSFFGLLLLIGCGVELAQAALVGHWAGLFYHLLAAILFGLTGFLFVTRPMISAEVATAVVAMFLMIDGLFQLIAALVINAPNWGWQIADGVITFVLGVLLFAQWPASGLWAIGLFVGIYLVFYGCAWIALAVGLRSM